MKAAADAQQLPRQDCCSGGCGTEGCSYQGGSANRAAGHQRKEQAHLAKALQRAQQESQRASAKLQKELQKQLQEQTARADALQAALNGSQASAAAAERAQPAASGELSQLHILLKAISIVNENPHLKQELLSAISS